MAAHALNQANQEEDGKEMGDLSRKLTGKDIEGSGEKTLDQSMAASSSHMEPSYEPEIDEQRFVNFKKMMEQSEVYTEFLNTKITTSTAQARMFECNRKQALMRHMRDFYCKRKIEWEKYLTAEVPEVIENDPFCIIDREMVNAAGQVVSMKQPFLLENATLRPYQIEGLNWLKILFEYHINGILADEMGLGKTIQSIALIAHLYEMKIGGYYLVVAPLSTVYNWIAEFQRFAPKIPVIMYHGSPEIRHELRKKFKPVSILDFQATPVIVTSYEIVMKDRSFLQGLKWRYMIIDEGHRLKNYRCRLIRDLKSLKASCRLILTGTPLQNNLSELWSLLNFLIPELFGSQGDTFESWFDADGLIVSENCSKIIKMEQDRQILTTMHRTIRPFVLRRMKSEVEINLPPKKEVLVYAPMTELQKEYYKATLDKSMSKVLGLEEEEPEAADSTDDEGPPTKRRRTGECSTKLKLRSCLPLSKRKMKVIVSKGRTTLSRRNITMQLRKITNHPYLVHFPYHPNTEEVKIDEELVKSSGKLLVLDAMLSKLKQMGHKILLFSQMTSLMDILEEYFEMRKYTYVRFDGSTKVEDRQAAIELFKEKETFIFLLSTRAGGLGINLTAADTVIIYDSDWNPQCDFQAIDRCHRIGQTLPVMVYRLVTSGTIDERMIELSRAKTKLEKMVIEKGQFRHKDENVGSISIQELQELLESENSQLSIQPNGLVFSDEELDCLLDREKIIKSADESPSPRKRTTPMKKRTHNKHGRQSLNYVAKNEGKSHNRVYKVL